MNVSDDFDNFLELKTHIKWLIILIIIANSFDILSTYYLVNYRVTSVESNPILFNVVHNGQWHILILLKIIAPCIGFLFSDLESRRSYFLVYLLITMYPVLNNLFYMMYGV